MAEEIGNRNRLVVCHVEVKVDDGHVERKLDVGCLIVGHLHGRRATWMKEWILGRLRWGIQMQMLVAWSAPPFFWHLFSILSQLPMIAWQFKQKSVLLLNNSVKVKVFNVFHPRIISFLFLFLFFHIVAGRIIVFLVIFLSLLCG